MEGDDLWQQLQEERRYDAALEQLRDVGLLPPGKDACKVIKKWFILLCGWKPVEGETEVLRPGVMGDACYGNSTIRDRLQRKMPTAGVGSLGIDRPLSLSIDTTSSNCPSAFTKVWINPYSHDQGVALATVTKALLLIEDLVDFKFLNLSTPSARKPPYDAVFPDGGTQWDKHMLNRKIKTGAMPAVAAVASADDGGDDDTWDSGADLMPTRMSEFDADLVNAAEKVLIAARPIVLSLFPTEMSALEVSCAGVREVLLRDIPSALHNIKMYRQGKILMRPVPDNECGEFDLWFLGKVEVDALLVLGAKVAHFAGTAHSLCEADVTRLVSLTQELRNNPAIAPACQDIFEQLDGPYGLMCQYDAVDARYHKGLLRADNRRGHDEWLERRRRNAGKTRQEIAADNAAADAAKADDMYTCMLEACEKSHVA
jgi:hypothetical protein